MLVRKHFIIRAGNTGHSRRYRTVVEIKRQMENQLQMDEDKTTNRFAPVCTIFR